MSSLGPGQFEILISEPSARPDMVIVASQSSGLVEGGKLYKWLEIPRFNWIKLDIDGYIRV